MSFMNKLKLIINILLDILIVFIFIITIYIVTIRIKSKKTNSPYVFVFGINLSIVETNSMEPNLNVKDLIISKKIKYKDELHVGDIVTFIYEKDGNKVPITHRIKMIYEEDGISYYITQGDNLSVTPLADETHTKGDLISKYCFKITFLGKVIDFIKTELGFLSIIVLPILLIIIYKIVSYLKIRQNKISNETREQIIKEYLESQKNEEE